MAEQLPTEGTSYVCGNCGEPIKTGCYCSTTCANADERLGPLPMLLSPQRLKYLKALAKEYMAAGKSQGLVELAAHIEALEMNARSPAGARVRYFCVFEDCDQDATHGNYCKGHYDQEQCIAAERSTPEPSEQDRTITGLCNRLDTINKLAHSGAAAETLLAMIRDQSGGFMPAPGSVPEPSGWQPIETAPKDGTHIIVTIAHRQGFGSWPKPQDLVTVAHWCEDGFYVSVFGGDEKSAMQYTHWMPLQPAPPKAAPDLVAAIRRGVANAACTCMGNMGDANPTCRIHGTSSTKVD